MSYFRKATTAVGQQRSSGFDFTAAGGTLQLLFDSRNLTGADGSAISSWSDTSGNARHAVQATALNQPTVVTNGTPNGVPAAAFADTSDLLTAPYGQSAPFTQYVVYRLDSTASGYLTANGLPGGLDVGTGGSGPVYQLTYEGSATRNTSKSVVSGVWTVMTVVQPTTTNSSTIIRFNQVAATTSALSGAGTTMVAASARFDIRGAAAGRVAFSALYSGAHTQAQYEAVESAIKAVYGV